MTRPDEHAVTLYTNTLGGTMAVASRTGDDGWRCAYCPALHREAEEAVRHARTHVPRPGDGVSVHGTGRSAGDLRVVGLDYSLTSAGIARVTLPGDGGPAQTYTTTLGRKGEQGETLLQRWLRLDRQATDVLAELGSPDLVLIEGQPPGTEGFSHDRSGGWWLAVDRFLGSSYSLGVGLAEVHVTHLKMFATGYGSGPHSRKPQVAEAVIARYGHLFHIPAGRGRGDVCDAVALAAMGCHILGRPLVEGLPASHLRALGSVRIHPEPEQRDRL